MPLRCHAAAEVGRKVPLAVQQLLLLGLPNLRPVRSL